MFKELSASAYIAMASAMEQDERQQRYMFLRLLRHDMAMSLAFLFSRSQAY